MKKPNAARLFQNAKRTMSKHSPKILTGIGIAGMVTTTILAVKATPKALELIDEAQRNLQMDNLPVVETVKATWKCYIPATAMGVTSIACLIGASSVNAKRTAALAAAYQISETAFAEYRDGVIKTIGDRKEKLVREQVSRDRVEKNPVTQSEVILTEKGNTLCLDVLSGRYFKSDIDKIKRSVNNLNERMLNDPFGYISLNDFYSELGLGETKIGDSMGWCMRKGQIRLDYDACLTEDGNPCMVIDYVNPPEYGFDKFD